MTLLPHSHNVNEFVQLLINKVITVPSSLSMQEQGVAGMSRPPGAIPPPHPAGGVASGVGPNQGSGPPPGYVGNQQQAAMMKQMMAIEQEKRVQMHMMEQQKQQLFREQRQQQQQQLLAEQVKTNWWRPVCMCIVWLFMHFSVFVCFCSSNKSSSSLLLLSGCMYNYPQPASFFTSPFSSLQCVCAHVCV